MSFMDARQARDLDRWITGNYGEKPLTGEQLADDPKPEEWKTYNVKFTSEPPPNLTWEEIKAELASLPEPTFCIDCGQPTIPGKGSARCAGCWEDRCGR